MRNITLAILLLITFTACNKALLEDTVDNSPQTNFQLFWDDFDQHYGLFQARNHNWDSIYNAYQPIINATTTDEELWTYLTEIAAYLDDSHTVLYDPSKDIEFESGSEENDIVEEEFSLNLVTETYLENFQLLNLVAEEVHLHGKIKDKNIGYLYFSDFEMTESNFIDKVLETLQTYDALIFDLRNNTGGVDEIAAEIAGRFADEERLLYTVQTRNGLNHDDFTPKTEYYSKKVGEQYFSKPVIVLTDKITVSTAEVFLTYMKSFPLVTQIGDVTAGDFSSIGMRRFLPNGWQYQYSIMRYLLPDGSSLDGIGHVPDVFIRNDKSDIQNQTDIVLEEAFSFLLSEYGIK